MPSMRDIALDLDEIDRVLSPAAAVPHDSATAPESIWAAQCEAVHLEYACVLAAWRANGAFPDRGQLIDAVSHAADLPTWNVARALAELGLAAAPAPLATTAEKSALGAERLNKVVAYLRGISDFATVAEIVKGTGLSPYHVRQVIDWEPSPLKRIPAPLNKRHPSKRIYAYQLRGFETKKQAQHRRLVAG